MWFTHQRVTSQVLLQMTKFKLIVVEEPVRPLTIP